MISPNLASSPPSTGVVMMNCNDKSVGGSSSSSTSGGAAGVEGSELGGAGGDSSALGKLAREQAVLRILYARPSVELRLESTADEVASLIHQQTYGSIHGDGTAGTVVSFSPFEQPSEMRDERLRT